MSLHKITNCLWFEDQAEEAVAHYLSTFQNSKITTQNYYPESGKDIHGRPPGSIMTISFELDGQPFVALNGGPVFKFTPATSFMVDCKDQAEVGLLFGEKLGEGGDPNAKQCGWLTDKFGVSWQIVPSKMTEMEHTADKKKMENLFGAMMPMKKLDIQTLTAAFERE